MSTSGGNLKALKENFDPLVTSLPISWKIARSLHLSCCQVLQGVTMAMMTWRAGWIGKTKVHTKARISNLNAMKIDLKTTMVFQMQFTVIYLSK
jgi:hypothetical protein